MLFYVSIYLVYIIKELLFMDTFQKIYKALMVITVISLIVLCLSSIGVINLSDKMTSTGIDTTGSNILLITVAITAMSFVFSRAGNVIANRKNTVFGYIAIFLGLIFLLSIAIFLIFNIKMTEQLNTVINIFVNLLMLSILLVLVFEIPPANTSHGKIQKLTAALIAFTFIFNFVTSQNENKNVNNTSSLLGQTTTVTLKKDSAMDKVKTSLMFASLGMFILNPMFRVYYLDKDYAQEKEIEDIIEKSAEPQVVVDAPNPTAVVSDKYRKKEPEEMKKEVPKPIVEPVIKEVEEVHHEKVINPHFTQENLPEAVIPMISGDDQNSAENTDEVTTPIVETSTPPAPSDTFIPTPEPEPPLEQPTVTNSDNAVNATPLDQVVQPSPVTDDKVVQQPEVATPLDQVIQPTNDK